MYCVYSWRLFREIGLRENSHENCVPTVLLYGDSVISGIIEIRKIFMKVSGHIDVWFPLC